MKIRTIKLFAIKAVAVAAILAGPFIASAASSNTIATSTVPVNIPEAPTILAGVLILLPLGASAFRILYKSRAARRHLDSSS